MTIFKISILVILIFNARTTSGQSACGGVYDAETLNSIPYVSIGSVTSNKFVLTDDFGRYCMNNLSVKDTFHVSALGYKKLIMDGKTLLNSDSLLLVSDPIQLKTVNVAARRNDVKARNIGFFKARSWQIKNSFAPNSNMKLAVYLNTSAGANNVISKVYYRLRPLESDIASFFRVRVRIYRNGVNNLPSDDLLTKNIILDISPEQTIIAHEILAENISIPADGLWLGIETVGYVDKSGNYHPTATGEAGEVTFKNSKKLETDKIHPISPYYRTSREAVGSSAKKVEIGKARWSRFEVLDDKLTFMFGAEVLVGK